MIIEVVSLWDLAYARSGDKGSHVNIGVIAYTSFGYEVLQKDLSADKVHNYFSSLGVKETIRYELPNIGALNFVLKGILEGGGSNSLRIDAQGKTLGQALLEMPLEISEHLLCRCRRPS